MPWTLWRGDHLHLPLYGGGAPDVAACVLPTVLAGADGLLRITADRHWASDVVVGAALGFGVGYGLPVLLHYGRGDSDSSPLGLGPVRWTVLPTVGPNELGLTLRGAM